MTLNLELLKYKKCLRQVEDWDDGWGYGYWGTPDWVEKAVDYLADIESKYQGVFESSRKIRNGYVVVWKWKNDVPKPIFVMVED